MRRTSKADVIVVGAGPAGCAHAIWCAMHGLRVIVFERQKFPRHRPGETLHPGADCLFAQLGVVQQMVAASPIRPRGYWIVQTNEPRFVRYAPRDNPEWFGYQILRSDCDSILLDRARQVGALVVQPCEQLSVCTTSHRMTGVVHRGQYYSSHFVVDATGAARWLSRQLKLSHVFRSQKLTARYGYAQGECLERNSDPCFEMIGSHWVWTAKVRPGLYHWSALSLNPHTQIQTPTIFRGMPLSERIYGADVTWRILQSPSGPGYFVIGDAASVVDPSSSHGVIRALMAGLQSAHMVLLNLGGFMTEAEASQRYSAWLTKSFETDTVTLEQLYRDGMHSSQRGSASQNL
jgi:flavin-dependent dehydrogenase